EPRVRGAGIHQERVTQLPHVAQPLEGGRVDARDGQGFETNVVPEGVANYVEVGYGHRTKVIPFLSAPRYNCGPDATGRGELSPGLREPQPVECAGVGNGIGCAASSALRLHPDGEIVTQQPPGGFACGSLLWAVWQWR